MSMAIIWLVCGASTFRVIIGKDKNLNAILLFPGSLLIWFCIKEVRLCSMVEGIRRKISMISIYIGFKTKYGNRWRKVAMI